MPVGAMCNIWGNHGKYWTPELKNWSMRFVTRAVCEDWATSEACGSYGFQGIWIKEKRKRPTEVALDSNQTHLRWFPEQALTAWTSWKLPREGRTAELECKWRCSVPDVLTLPSGKSCSVCLWDRASMTVTLVSTLSLCNRETTFLKKVQRSLSCKISLRNSCWSLTSVISVGFSFSVT